MIITLSLSSAANHVTAQLFNAQEAHLPYTKSAPRFHDYSVFLSTTKNKNGSTNYAPRALVYDLNGGFGGAPKYEVDPSTIANVEVISTAPRVPKHAFQTNLDSGIDDPKLLSVSNTRYWTDYNKLLYKPSSLVSLQNWESGTPYGTNRNFSRLKFDTHSVGWEEYKRYQETSTDEFRKYLEECDLLQGVTVFSDYHSGWGGFSSHLLLDLKDEFFNNGANNKHSIWVYGLARDHGRMDVNQKCSSIASFVELAQQSSLFFPICPSYESQILAPDFDRTSEWHQSSLTALLVNSLWELQSRKENPVHMAEFEDQLTRGSNRNIVGEMSLKAEQGSREKTNEFGVVDVPQDQIWGLMNSVSIANKPGCLNMGLSCSSHEFSRAKVQEKTGETSKNAYTASFSDITTGSTFPPTVNGSSLSTEFAITSGIVATLKEHRKFLLRIKHNENLGDREELVEDVSSMIEEYQHGYDESDEEFDI
ncbi:Protein DML1 [Meyerozyma sp. JA9]|nr:Protein DML1 [Meyerozyma sp. JA9]